MSAPAIANPIPSTATGPRTFAGKARSSQNACKHNFTGGTAFVEGEDLEAYEAHVDAQLRQYKPIAEHEIYLTYELADAMWRMGRVNGYEADLLGKCENPFDDEETAAKLQRLARYKASIERTYYRAFNELKRINAERNKSTGISYDIHTDYSKQPIDIWHQMRSRQNEPAPPRPLPVSGIPDLAFMKAEFEKFKKTGQIG